jgi:hypothetical protein
VEGRSSTTRTNHPHQASKISAGGAEWVFRASTPPESIERVIRDRLSMTNSVVFESGILQCTFARNGGNSSIRHGSIVASRQISIFFIAFRYEVETESDNATSGNRDGLRPLQECSCFGPSNDCWHANTRSSGICQMTSLLCLKWRSMAQIIWEMHLSSGPALPSCKIFFVWNGPDEGRSRQIDILHALHQLSYIGD